MISDDKLKKVYNTLRNGGYTQDYGTFKNGFLGEENYENRKKVYDLLTANGAQIGANYHDFLQKLRVDADKEYFKLRRGGRDFTVPRAEVEKAGGLQPWAQQHPGAPLRVYMHGKQADGSYFDGHTDATTAAQKLKNHYWYTYTTTPIGNNAKPVKQAPAKKSNGKAWKPSAVDMAMVRHNVNTGVNKLHKIRENATEDINAIKKGGRPDAAMLIEREPNTATGKMERRYYTEQGAKVASRMEQSRRNNVYNQWWENNTEEGKRSKEQRLQREFEGSLSSLWSRIDATETSEMNAAERAWKAAEARQKAAREKNAQRNWGAYSDGIMLASHEMRTVTASSTAHEDLAARYTNYDLDRLMDDAWNNLGAAGQKAVIDDCYRMLARRNPGADGTQLREAAQQMARQQSDLRLYELAVEKKRPKSELDYLMRKIGDMNLLGNITKGMAVWKSGKTGDMAAYEMANEQYRQDGHKLLDVVGTVLGFMADPTTYISGGVGGVAGKAAVKGATRAMIKKGTSAAVRKAFTRKFANTFTGRLIGGVSSSSANFGFLEGAKELENQFAHGGKVRTTDDEGNLLREGRYVNEGYSGAAVAEQALHGMGMGAAIGWLGPTSGNVSDYLVRGTKSTAGKVMTRAGVYTGATIAEGTIFSVPEWLEGSRDAVDVWTDNLAMMVGFKGKHIIKSAGGVLKDLKASFSHPTDGRKNRLDFESRVRMRMDAPTTAGIAVYKGDEPSQSMALTKDERAELKRYGYDIKELTEPQSSLVAENAPEIVDKLTEMVRDQRVSEAARAKMYYYATGRRLPMSTVMRGELYEDDKGGFRVKSIGANGVITSRSFKHRKNADIELKRIKRQVELNSIELGEQYKQAADLDDRMREACRTVAEENGWEGGAAEIYRICVEARENHLRGNDKELDEAQQLIVRKVVDAMGDYQEGKVTDELRASINEKYDVDIDDAIRKEENRRKPAEQQAIEEYINELFPKEKEKPVEDAEAEEVAGITEAGNQQPVGRAVMNDDREVEVMSGNIVMTDDGTMVDKQRSDETIVIRDVATGKVEMVSRDDILRYEAYGTEEGAPEESASEVPAAGTEEAPAEPTASAESRDARKYGEGRIVIIDADGKEKQGWLTGEVDEQGRNEYYVVGDETHFRYATDEDLDGMLKEYHPVPKQEAGSEEEQVIQKGIRNTVDGLKDSLKNERERIANQVLDRENVQAMMRGYAEGASSVEEIIERAKADCEDEASRQRLDTMLEFDSTRVRLQKLLDATRQQVSDPSKAQAEEQPQQTEQQTEQQAEKEVQSDEQLQPEEEKKKELTALQRIPLNEKKEPIFEQADSPETAWDALVEFSEGDAATAKEIADTMAEEKRKVYEKAQKQKAKGKTPTEILASKKANAGALAQAESEYNFWQKIAGVEKNRHDSIRSQQEAEARLRAAERAEAQKAEREANEEAERREREASEGIPEMHLDTPENARKRGARRYQGEIYKRQEPLQGVVGNEVEVKFSQNDLPKGRVVVIEAEQLQPSHIQGQLNPMFFINEAQPKDRAEGVSATAAQKIAEGIRPEEITGSPTAFVGAPTVNSRGEVIQGNNRSDALRYLWENNLTEQQQAYKQYLIDHAEQFGLDAEAVRTMKHPVMVNMLDVDDAKAIQLGQMTAQDTESGGIERIKAKNAAQKMGDSMQTFANLLLNTKDEDATFGQLVDLNGAETLKWMNRKGIISNTQYQSAFDSKGALTPEAKNDLQKVLYQSIFKGGSQQLEEMFNRLPAKAQRAILSTAFRDMSSPEAGKMLPEIQSSVIAFAELMGYKTFAEAKNLKAALAAVEDFKRQYALDDRFEQYMPADNFSNFALHLAAFYKAGDVAQRTLATYFNNMFDLAQGRKEATLYEPADTTPHPLADVIKQVFGIDYEPAKNGKKYGKDGSIVLAVGDKDGQGGERGGTTPPAGGERAAGGTEPSERGAGASDDSRGVGTDKRGGESEAEAPQTKLSKEDATDIIAKMEMSAVNDPQISLSPESWQNSFGLSNSIDTPLGKVKMGEGQYQKFVDKKRSAEFGMVVQTLQDPDVVFIEPSEAKEGQATERDFSYVFVKTFIRNGQKFKYYTSVSVLKDGMEVSVSSHIASKTAIMKKLQGMERAYTKQSLLPNSSEWHLAEHPTDVPDLLPTQGKSDANLETSEKTVSDRKVNNSASEKQVSGQESSVQPSDSKGEQTVQTAVEAASAQMNTTPTPAQAEAGNYKKGHVTIGEFDITIENPAGSVRKGVDADGKEWSNTMANTYGYIKGTEGVDGDHIDVFLHSDMDQWNGRKVFVVDQTNRDGSFDEHKVMLGFNDKDEAMTAYLANYDKTWADTHPGLRISETNIEDFNKWVQSSHRKTKPFADYTTVSKVVDEAPVKTEANIGEGYKIESNPYTNKQGKTLDTYLVTFDRDFSKEELSALRAKAKALKGWYDRESKGWMLRSSEDAKAFAEEVTAKSEDEVADEAPLSMADMEKPAAKPKKAEAPAKPTESPMKQVDVEGVFDALKTKGETKLNEHATPAQEAPKPKKRRWISDEDADEFDSLRKDLRNHFGKDGDIVQEAGADYGKPKPKQMDAEVLRMGTRMTYLMMKGGLRSFSDYCEAMKDELPDIFDDMRPHLKSLYAAAQNMEEVIELGWDDEMDDRKTVKAFDVYNFDKPGAKDIVATAQHVVDEQASQEQTSQIVETLKDKRNDKRRKEADATSADSAAVASQAEAVASQTEGELEAARTEQGAAGLSDRLDKEIEKVNGQLALLGYYEADTSDPSKFHESYGYMLTAEKKALADATRLTQQLAKDLGIDPGKIKSLPTRGKAKKDTFYAVRSNLAPACGDISIRLPLGEDAELYMDISVEPAAERGGNSRIPYYGYADNLEVRGGYFRVENPKATGHKRYVTDDRHFTAEVTYDDLLADIRRDTRHLLPEERIEPGKGLTPQPGEDYVAMAERVAADKEPKAPAVEPQLPIGDLFGGLFDEQPQAPQPTAPAKGKEIDPATKRVVDILKGGGLKPTKAKNDNLCKLLPQYEDMKQKHPDAMLLFRSGNNYYVLSTDAEEVANLLNLPLSKFTNDGTEIPFTEFPHHALDKYLPQMVRAGKRVAVCEQIDEPEIKIERKPKSEVSTSKPKSNEKTDVQPRTEGTGRGGQQPRPNEPLGEGAKNEAERTDGGRMAQRGGEHSVSDTGRGAGVSGQHHSERGVTANDIDNASVPDAVKERAKRALTGSGSMTDNFALGEVRKALGESAEPKRNSRNNHLERGEEVAPKGEKARIEANLAAIELAKELLSTGREATSKEMKVLRRYSGWGGLGSVFKEGDSWARNPLNQRLRELLTPEEYDAAVMSRNSAYFTPAEVIDAMWDIAKGLGFKGGKVLEGSAGIGKILGQMPLELSGRSDLHAVEIDDITGGILKLLYPDAQVDVQGFEKTRIANGSVDLAITNVPFVTGLHVMDESGDRDLSKKFRDIHDFCIAKNVRKLREGGIGIFITSRGTLDNSQKLRNWLVNEGCSDVVGVFRMHNETFGGTAATSDIIVVRKRVNGRKSAHAIDVSTATSARVATYRDINGTTKDLPLLINRYFIEHPEYMGGEMYFGFERGDKYRPTSIGLFPTRDADQAGRMTAWVKSLAEKDWSHEQGVMAASDEPTRINEALGDDVKEGGIVIDSEGQVCVARRGTAVPLMSKQAGKGKPQKTEAERIELFQKKKIRGQTKAECYKDYSAIKEALGEVLRYEAEHEDDRGLEPLLGRLNEAYDRFVERYGYLHKNNMLAWLRNDVDYPSVLALETFTEKGDKSGKRIQTFGKTDVFRMRVVEKEAEPEPRNVKDGIIASLYK